MQLSRWLEGEYNLGRAFFWLPLSLNPSVKLLTSVLFSSSCLPTESLVSHMIPQAVLQSCQLSHLASLLAWASVLLSWSWAWGDGACFSLSNPSTHEKELVGEGSPCSSQFFPPRAEPSPHAL